MHRCFAFAVVALLAALALPHPAAGKGDPALTFRISGGDLPHPVTVSLTEATLVQSDLGDLSSATGLPQPPANAPRYRVESISLKHPDEYFGSWLYVETPPLDQSLGTRSTGWSQPVPALADLLNRYIDLGRQDRIGETPSFAEVLRASAATWPPSISIGGSQLTGADKQRALSLIQQIEPVYYGVQAHMLGGRKLHDAEVRVTFGTYELTFAYVPPGPVAPYGLLFPPGVVGNWDYIGILDPPGYAQLAYTVPSAFESLMAARGIEGGPVQEIVSPRTVPLVDVTRTTGIDRLEVWTGAGPHAFIQYAGGGLESPDNVCVGQPYGATAPPGVEPTKVAVWLKGIEPFPEAVTPAVYDYYPPSPGISTRGIFVERQAGALYSGGPSFGLDPPCYTSNEVDALLANAHATAGNGVATRGAGSSILWVTTAILAAGLAIGVVIALAALRSLRPVAPR